jgi:Sulfotransferase domain
LLSAIWIQGVKKMSAIDAIKPAYWAARSSFRLLTSRWRVLPDFIILGTQRGGTTSLYYYLTAYAGVLPAQYKEVHFFDDHCNAGLRWYRAQFPTRLRKLAVERVERRNFVTGESSPYYLFHPHVPKRVAGVLPGAKLIILLRNPVDRAYSHHWLAVHEGHETLSFDKAIKCESERLAGEEEKMLADERYESYHHRHHSYLSRGIYVDQLQHWMRFFPREQFLVLKSEDLFREPVTAVKQTLEFLGLPTTALDASKPFKQYREPTPAGYRNKEQPRKLDPELRQALAEYYTPHNARLYEFLGRDFGWDK